MNTPTTAPWYDSAEGIADALARGLAGFDDLRKARHAAGYDRREDLRGWVYSRYWFDRCGNVLVSETPVPGPVALRLRDEVDLAGMTFAHRRVASVDDVCTRCGEGWNLRDAWDFVRIDDVAYHRECRAFEVHEQVRDELAAMLASLGIDAPLRAIPNRYGSGDYAGPWFLVDVPRLGAVRFGWRKRVIEIEWRDGPDGREVFANDRVTCDRNLVHAWSLEQARDFLTRLVVAATPAPTREEIVEAGRLAFPGLKWDRIEQAFNAMDAAGQPDDT